MFVSINISTSPDTSEDEEYKQALEDNIRALFETIDEYNGLLVHVVRNHKRWLPFISYYKSEQALIDALWKDKHQFDEMEKKRLVAEREAERRAKVDRSFS